jgi:hypothetical protein
VSGWLFLGIVALISFGVFANGMRFSRMSEDRLGGVQLEMPSFLAKGRTRVEQTRLFGRISMIAAPLFLVLVAALCFGLFGPVDGIETIKFTSGVR